MIAVIKVLHQEIPKTLRRSLQCHFILYHFILMSIKPPPHPFTDSESADVADSQILLAQVLLCKLF